MKATHILLFIAACCISVPAFATEKLSVGELLDKYAENQDKMKSLIARTESVWIPSAENVSGQQLRQNQSKSIVEFRYEDTGKDFKAYFCRTPLKLESDGTWVEKNASRSTKLLWRDKRYYQYYKGPRLAVSNLYVTADAEYAGNEHFEIAYDGVGPFLGFLCGDRERIDSILRQSGSLSVRPDLDQVGSVKCYVVDAVSRHGTYTIWLDLEHGYGIAKAIVRKGPEDLRWGRPRSNNTNSFDNSTNVMQNVRFESVNGIWFPMEYERLSKREYEDRTQSSRTYYKVTYLDVNPDHNGLGSFSLDGLDIQEGTRIRIADAPEKPPRIEHTWQEGKKFVVDEWDGRIQYVPKDWSILVGVGRELPEFEGIDLDLSAENTRDKAILLCFFNMNQRPSRNCLLQLSRRAQELMAKDVVVVAVQASKIDDSVLKEWVEKNNIPFTVGMVQGDEEKTRFTWGVRSLPWLILTDKEHTVTAEGFGIEKLDEELKKTEAIQAKQTIPTNGSESSQSFLNAEEILAAWESTYGSIRTMRFSYVDRLVDFQPSQTPEDNPDEPPPNPGKKNHVERIEEGKRYHLRYSLAENGFKNPEWLVEYAFDGKITQSYMGSTKSGVVFLGQRSGSEEIDEGLKRFMFLTNHNTPDVLRDEYPNGIPELALWFKLGKLRGKVIVRPNLEYVAGQPCHVVEVIDDSDVGGKPRELKQVFWMAHDKGMCPMKFQMLQNGELEKEIAIEKIAVIDIDDSSIWYPQKAYRTVSHDEIGTIRNELTVTDFVPNVEVDEDTFRLDFIEGTQVADRTSMKSYKWLKGMKFILDEWNNSICYVPKDWSIRVGVSKELPEFEGIDLDITVEDTIDKAILLCFFDMNQRPSRNCLLQLSKRAKELMAKDVVLVAVHASKVDNSVFDEWLKKNNITSPVVGMIQGDEEKIRFTWGVRSLPWLILTDKEHVVIAEGFSVAELDEKLNDNSH